MICAKTVLTFRIVSYLFTPKIGPRQMEIRLNRRFFTCLSALYRCRTRRHTHPRAQNTSYVAHPQAIGLLKTVATP